MAAAAQADATAASSVSTTSQSESHGASTVARGSSNELTPATRAANGMAESDDEVTTAEFTVDLTDGQTWAINFYECAAEGDLECLEEILDSGHVRVNDVDVDGFTALMVAAAEGHRDVVFALLRQGADVSIQTHELRSTALHFAAKNGDAEIIAALCACDGAVVDAWNINADTPLIWACIDGRAEAVKVLLEHGADINVLNQYGASTLLCAVMSGDDPTQDAESDAQRADIVSMLLQKNKELVNFQDREGSTAMHLAASCGYLKCVKTLLAFGADITLRNVMGQTPLDEAQDSHVRESLPCVEHLRGIWRQLEEEAATRMMAMLEMEDAADKSATGLSITASRKKSKKKSKKAKRNAAKLHQQQHEWEREATLARGKVTEMLVELPGTCDEKTTAKGVDIAQQDNERWANSDEKRARLDQAFTVPLDQNSDEKGGTTAVVCQRAHRTNGRATGDVETTPSGDTWTTVGGKHRLALGSILTSSVKASARLPQNGPTRQKSITTSLPQPRRWTPQQSSTAPMPSGNRTALKMPASRCDVAGTSTRRPWELTKSLQTPSSILDPNAPAYRSLALTLENTQLSETSAFHSSSMLSASTSPWRPSVSSSPALTLCPNASLSLPSTGPHYVSSGRFSKMQQRHNRYHKVASKGRDRWLSKLRLWNDNVAETLGCLACGLCGEIVHDNLQCSGNTAGLEGTTTAVACTQLYCASCLESSAFRIAHASTFKCVQCHQMIAKESMTRNTFAQAQAASLGLSMSSVTSSDDSIQYSLHNMQQLFEATDARVSTVDLSVFQLVPGMDLGTLSNGQLEVLENVHQRGLALIVEQRVANGRALERLRLEEWLKMQRDVLHYTPR